MTQKKRLGENQAFISIVASLLSIVIGLLFGFILLLLLNAKNAPAGMWNMLSNGITDFGNVLYRSTPLIMTGLSVAIAFKVGLFNIGAPGQYTIGAMAALFFALVIKAPWYVCVLMSIVGGAVWGFFPGLFKALFNVNEVITSIMMNWIGMNCANLLVLSVKKMLASDGARSLALDAGNPSAIMPRLGLDKLYVYLNIGIFIAAIIAVIVWFVMSKTTFGYELRACGLNRDGAIYAGINAKRNIVLSVVIAGALAGLGGGLHHQGLVQGLPGEHINDPHRDSLGCQELLGLESLVHQDSGGDDRGSVLAALTQRHTFANLKLSAVPINLNHILAGKPGIGDALPDTRLP